MKIYIFNRLEKVSNNYYEGGGLVVIARDIKHLIELKEEEGHIRITKEEMKKCRIYELKGKNIEPKIFVMPDAGRC